MSIPRMSWSLQRSSAMMRPIVPAMPVTRMSQRFSPARLHHLVRTTSWTGNGRAAGLSYAAQGLYGPVVL